MKYEIYNNGIQMLSGDSIQMIWNNITGKNMESDSEYLYYKRFIKSRGFESGTFELRGDGATIQKIDLNLP